MTSDERQLPRRPVMAAIAVTVSAALAGALIGIALDRTVLARVPAFPRDLPTPPGLEQSPAKRKQFMDMLARELDLTDAQRVQVEALVAEESPRMRAAFDSARGIMEQAARTPQDRLLKILTPAQQQRFRRMMPRL